MLMNSDRLPAPLRSWLHTLRLGGCRLELSAPLQLDLSLVRRHWEHSLKHFDPSIHRRISQRGHSPPSLMLRPAEDAQEIEIILLGQQMLDDEPVLLQAWMALELNGVGRDLAHQLIRVGKIFPIDPCGPRPQPPRSQYRLEEIPWPLPNDPENNPFRLCFDLPLCLETGSLSTVLQPTWANILDALLGRLAELAGETVDSSVQSWVEEQAECHPARPWKPIDTHSAKIAWYSKAMCRRGVRGCLEFPVGVGPLWPCVAILPWIQVGRLVHIGFGSPRIEQL